MDYGKTDCPICKQSADFLPSSRGCYDINIQCDQCGNFCMTKEDYADLHLESSVLRKIERYLYDTRNGTERLLTSGSAISCQWPGPVLSLGSVEQLYNVV